MTVNNVFRSGFLSELVMVVKGGRMRSKTNSGKKGMRACKFFGPLMMALCLLGTQAFADARQWEGLYLNPDNMERSRMAVSLRDCNEQGCHLSYSYQGWHACHYDTEAPTEWGAAKPGERLYIEGSRGHHHFEKQLDASGQELYQAESLVCEITVLLEQDGLDRWVTLEDVSGDCMRVGPCGARAGINPGIRMENERSRPSFDCRRASSDIERLICRELDLGELDARLARAYRSLRSDLDAVEQEQLRRDQLRWLRDKRQSCRLEEQPSACLAAVYSERIEDLETLLEYKELMQRFSTAELPDFRQLVQFDAVLASLGDRYGDRRHWQDYPRFLAFMAAAGVPEPVMKKIQRQDAWMEFSFDIEPKQGLLIGRDPAGNPRFVVTVDQLTGLWIHGAWITGEGMPEAARKGFYFSSQDLDWSEAPHALISALNPLPEEAPYQLPTALPAFQVNQQGQLCAWGRWSLQDWEERLVQLVGLPAFIADVEARLETGACFPDADRE